MLERRGRRYGRRERDAGGGERRERKRGKGGVEEEKQERWGMMGRRGEGTGMLRGMEGRLGEGRGREGQPFPLADPISLRYLAPFFLPPHDRWGKLSNKTVTAGV